jgi:hypothetical protein
MESERSGAGNEGWGWGMGVGLVMDCVEGEGRGWGMGIEIGDRWVLVDDGRGVRRRGLEMWMWIEC